jgi:hypothetical protein
MSTTLEHLNNLWGRAMLDDDFDAARRWREAREHLEAYELKHAQHNPCAVCPWTNSDTCRTCALSGVKA